MSATHLVSCEDLEWLHDLLSSVSVGSLTRHEVKEGLEGNVAGPVGVDNRHDALEVRLSLRSWINKSLIYKLYLLKEVEISIKLCSFTESDHTSASESYLKIGFFKNILVQQ